MKTITVARLLVKCAASAMCCCCWHGSARRLDCLVFWFLSENSLILTSQVMMDRILVAGLWGHPHPHTQPFYSSLDFVRDNPGELLPEGTFRHLLDFLVQNEDNTGIHWRRIFHLFTEAVMCVCVFVSMRWAWWVLTKTNSIAFCQSLPAFFIWETLTLLSMATMLAYRTHSVCLLFSELKK